MIRIEPTPIAQIVQAYNSLSTLFAEDVLDLQTIPVAENPEDDHIFDTEGYFQLDNEDIDPIIETIPAIEFIPLFNEVSNLRIAGSRYITALQISFGYKEGNIDLIYQPLCLRRVFYDGATQKDMYDVHAVGAVYFFNGTEFEKEAAGQSASSISNYKNSISIHNNGLYRNYNEAPIFTDVNSCIFPFQTIFTLVLDNLKSQEGDEPDPNLATVTLHNCVRKVNYDLDNPAKHALLLSSHEIHNIQGPFSGRFANRSHLCPPCNGVNIGYDLA